MRGILPSLILVFVSWGTAVSANCDRKLSGLSNSLIQSLDELGSIRSVHEAVDLLLDESPDHPSIPRLNALARSFRFLVIFDSDLTRIQRILSAIHQEEKRLLDAIRGSRDPFSKLGPVQGIVEFNRIFYPILNHVEGELLIQLLASMKLNIQFAPEKGSSLSQVAGIDKTRIASSLKQLESQYENVFAKVFPLEDEGLRSQIQEGQARSLLQQDLHSLDLFRSHRARYFLSLFLGQFSERLRMREHPNAKVVYELLYDFEKERSNTELPFIRNRLPIGFIRGKPADYKELPDQTLDEVRALAETFEDYQVEPGQRRIHLETMRFLIEAFSADEFFVIIPKGEVAEGLTLYQLAYLSNIKPAREAILRAAQRHPLFGE